MTDSSREDILRSRAKVRLIEGNPGVGKTWFGCQLAQYELDNPILGVPPYQKVLFLTFARNAVARIRQVFTEQALADDKKAKAFAQRVRVDTFCGFFWWLVECYGRYAKNGTTKRLWLIGSRDVGGAPVPQGHEGYTFDKIEAKALELLRIVAVRKLISEVYPLVVIDEFQDVHDRLFEIIEALGARSRFVLLRGPGQCIYRGLPGKEFDPDLVRQKCVTGSGVVTFELPPLGDDKQRYQKETADLISSYTNDEIQQQTDWPIKFLSVPRKNQKDVQNHLESFANRTAHEMIERLRKNGKGSQRVAILASTNMGVGDIARAIRKKDGNYVLDEASGKYINVKSLNASLASSDSLLLQYGRLMLRLLRTHWITGKAEQIEPTDVAVLVVLLFQEQSRTVDRDPSSWVEFARVLVDTAHGQKKAKKPSDWRSRLEGNLATLNNLLHANQKKQRGKGITNCHSTAFDEGDAALLETLRDEFIASIKKDVDACGRLDVEKAAISFEKANQQKVVFEKLGIQKNVQVMTIHKSKGREFDGVILVLETSRKAIWRRDSNASDQEIEDLYRVAISRARSAFALVAFDDAWKDASEPVRRLLPEKLFHRNA